MHDGQDVDVFLPNPVDEPIRPFDDFADVRCSILRHHTS
jgi:hypothetical protein